VRSGIEHMSRDGKYVYTANPEDNSISVVDILNMKNVYTLTGVQTPHDILIFKE
jgi:YVTN family beta-propeller protein